MCRKGSRRCTVQTQGVKLCLLVQRLQKPTILLQKLKRFFMIDLIRGMGLTLKYNIGALTRQRLCRGQGNLYRTVSEGSS